jgi:segregation and condensation protein A
VGYRLFVPDTRLADAAAPAGERVGFEVRLDSFTGPFDLLLSLIAKHRLEVTELALARVTDDFVAHLRAQGEDWSLDETTQFLVVAAILLDLKAARLLPGEAEEDAEDLALLEARDLLFARLLQYRAFKDASELFGALLYAAPPRIPREVGLDPELLRLLPEVTIGVDAQRFADIAVRAMTPKTPDEVSVAHVHAAVVSVREQATVIVARLRRSRQVTFRALVADAPDPPHVIARFLALLELYREGAVSFEQAAALGELLIRWTGSDEGEVEVADEFDTDDRHQGRQSHDQHD